MIGRLTRRGFLAAGVVLAGCSAGGPARPGATPSASPAPDAGDLERARLEAGIEAVLVTAHDAVLAAAAAGSLGRVPAAIASAAATARQHHLQHRDDINALLVRRGLPPAPADPSLRAAVAGRLAELRTAGDAAELLLRLETIAMETHVAAAASSRDPSLRLMSLTMAPVEAQHAAILNLLLGRYPVPDAEIRSDLARHPADLRG